METQRLANKIDNLHGYSDAPITYQLSKYCPIDGMYCSAPLAETWGGLLSFGRLVEYHRDPWIDINENILLGFWQHYIISPMARNLQLAYPRTINKFNDTPHTRFFYMKYTIISTIYTTNLFIHSQHI